MTIGKIVRRLHLWAGLILGIQIFIWMLSGFVMTFYDLDLVRGERTAISAPLPELDTTSYASPGGVIAQTDGAQSVELKYFLGRPVYEVHGVQGAALFDALTGEQLSPLSEKLAQEVAKADFVGDGEIDKLRLLDKTPNEYRGSLPVWRADFTDRLHTRLYISPETGKVVSRRNDIWRVYDFFWMLHIMDYTERSNFNNPLVIGFSFASLLFAFTGLLMLVLKNGRMQLAGDVRYVTKFFSRLFGSAK